MRILIATPQQAVVGGIETYLRELMPGLRNRGHDLALVCEFDSPAEGPRIDDGLTDVPCWQLRSEEGVAAAIAWKPDICYLQGLQSPIDEARLLDQFPGVFFAHAYHGTCVSGTKRHGLPRPRPCDRTLGVGCLFAYLPCRCGGTNPVTMLRLYRLQRRRQALLTRYQTVAVASTHMRDEYRRHGVADDRLQLLPLFPTGQCPDPQPPSPRDPMGRILFVGRLTDLKGGLLLVEALRLARPVLPMPLTLTVAGDGPERQQMEFAARQAGIATEFTGWVDAQQREQLMRRADLLAVPATWPEPFGLVGVEAGCVGLPAVGFAVGGIPDWLRAGESGELAPGDPPTAPGLAEAIVRALSEPARWHHIRQGAWRTAQQFTLERHLTGLEELFRRAIGSTRRAEWPLCSVEVGG